MVEATAALATIFGAIVLLYVLIKGHLYATRKLWEPVIEEQVESSTSEESGDFVSAEGEDAEASGVEDVPRGWDEVR